MYYYKMSEIIAKLPFLKKVQKSAKYTRPKKVFRKEFLHKIVLI